MAGLVNDNIVFPILDLIRQEIQRYMRFEAGNDLKNVVLSQDPVDEIPSVTLIRDDPNSPTKVTGAEFDYPSGYRVSVYLYYGGDGIPDTTLSTVAVASYDLEGNAISAFNIILHYGSNGLLEGTSVYRAV